MSETAGPDAGRPWRCFVGLPLPEAWHGELDRVVARLAKRLASRISWTKPGNWHVTLKFLGDVDAARLPELAAALSGVCFAPFALKLGTAGQFHQRSRAAPRALWAGLAEETGGAEHAARLAAQVDQALASCGLAPESRPFRAHVTLGRVKDAAGGEDWDIVAEELARGDFGAGRAERFVLWRSILGPGGPKYAALYGFPARRPATTAGG